MHRLIIALAVSAALAAPAAAEGWRREYNDGPYEIEEKAGPDGYKYKLKGAGREVKRKVRADGTWKEEIKDDGCEVKRKGDAFGVIKEERDCD
jgi:hypothetical protein